MTIPCSVAGDKIIEGTRLPKSEGVACLGGNILLLLRSGLLAGGEGGTEKGPSPGLPERSVLSSLYKNLEQKLFLPLLSRCFSL